MLAEVRSQGQREGPSYRRLKVGSLDLPRSKNKGGVGEGNRTFQGSSTAVCPACVKGVAEGRVVGD